MHSITSYPEIVHYHDVIATMSGQVDLFLAEVPLDDKHVEIANNAKIKYDCVAKLLDKGYYMEAVILDDDARYDMSVVFRSVGLNHAADELIETLVWF